MKDMGTVKTQVRPKQADPENETTEGKNTCQKKAILLAIPGLLRLIFCHSTSVSL